MCRALAMDSYIIPNIVKTAVIEHASYPMADEIAAELAESEVGVAFCSTFYGHPIIQMSI